MPTKKKKGKERLDKFYHLAKEQNLRARSAFKLIQLDKRFGFLGRARGVIDLCAAPGGWMQVARRNCPAETFIVGVDLVPIRPVKGCVGLVGDIHSEQVRSALRGEIRRAGAGVKIDVVLHDGAPNVGSSWHMDAYNQSELVLGALKLAVEFLEPGGVFATKVFRSQDYNALMWVFQQLFESAQATKPVASRNVSAEIFVVCRGFKAPKKIDPRFLDPRSVFKQTLEAVEGEGGGTTLASRGSVELFRDPAKKRRRAEGYDDGVTLLRRVCPVSEFVNGEDAVLMLTSYNSMTWDGTSGGASKPDAEAAELSAKYRSRPETDTEIVALFEDLKVLNKKDYKSLLRWRDRMRDADEAEKRANEASSEELDTDTDTDDSLASTDSSGAILDKELATAREEELRIAKRRRRALRKKRAKIQRRIDMKMILPGDYIDAQADEETFALSLMGTAEDVAKVRTADQSVYDEIAGLTDEKEQRIVINPGLESDSEDDGLPPPQSLEEAQERDRQRRIRALDREAEYHEIAREGETKTKKSRIPASKRQRVDDALDEFAPSVQRRQNLFAVDTQSEIDPERPVARKAENDGEEDDDLGDQGDQGSDMADSSDEDLYDALRARARGEMTARDSGSKQGSNPLLADAGRLSVPDVPSAKAAAVWFSNPLFDGVDNSDAESSAGVMAMADTTAPLSSDSEDSDSSNDGGKTAGKKGKKNNSNSNKASKAAKTRKTRESADSDSDGDGSRGSHDDGFDIAPSAPELSDSEASFDDVGDAEILALGAQMAADPKVKSDLIDDAYNRYAFNDGPLPQWFTRDESLHNRPELPVTKAEVEKMKERMRLVNSRPIKKIAEARARKKHRAAKTVEKIQAAMRGVVDSEATEKEKARALEKMTKQMSKRAKPGRVQFVVSRGKGQSSEARKQKGNGKTSGKVKTKVVDKRMKADLRGQKASDKKKGGAKKGKKGRR